MNAMMLDRLTAAHADPTPLACDRLIKQSDHRSVLGGVSLSVARMHSSQTEPTGCLDCGLSTPGA